MKRLLAVLFLFAVPASGQVVEKGRTIADLIASHPCASGLTNRIARVTDADAADDLGDGEGAFQVWVLCDGSAPWEIVSIGGGGSGTGDVVGPASATDNAIARFDLTTGKIIQDSAVTVADTTGNLQWEGATADGFEGNFTFTDPTADWTWSWTSVGVLQGPNIEIASGTGANFYGDTSVSISANRGGSGFPLAIYNSDDSVFGVENQGANSARVILGASVAFGWSPNTTFTTPDTTISRSAAGVVNIVNALNLTPVASPPRACAGGTVGDIYSDTSLALCYCDGTAFQVLNPLTAGVGTCS